MSGCGEGSWQREVRSLVVSCWLLTAVACGGAVSTDNGPDCAFAAKDHFTDIQTGTIAGRPFKLVQRVTGFQEKMVLIELYPAEMQLDACGKPSVPHASQVMVDAAPGQELHQIQVQNSQITLVYSSAAPPAAGPPTVTWQ